MKNNYCYKSKYFEKNSKESHTFIAKNLEINQYLEKILKDQNINLYNQQINLAESHLNVFLPIHETEQTIIHLKKNKSSRNKKLNELGKKLITLKNQIKKYFIKKKWKKTRTNKTEILKLYKISLWKFYMLNKTKVKDIKKLNNLSNEQVLENLSLFANYKSNIQLKLKQINSVEQIKNLLNKSYKVSSTKRILLKLRKFERNQFFKEGKYILVSTRYNSANLLANFISKQFQIIKRHNFFLSFLKESLSVVVNFQKHSKIKGIKVVLKGRLNNAARSNHKVITLGKIGLITNKFNTDYAESTAFTSNGTIGIKVWICKK